MHVKRITVPTITMAIIASQLMGCGAMSQSELLKMINNGDTIEIEIAVPENYSEADESALAWIILASLTSQESMRAQWDDTLKITMTGDGKDGCLYVDAQGNNENNNTLRVALHNKAFIDMLQDTDIINTLAGAADTVYTDVDAAEDADKAFYMALNAYFNILPDSADGEANADDALTRKEFMAMVARSELQVDETLAASEEFNTLVGESAYNVFAEQEAEYSYLDTASKSLNNKTYNGVMSRGEAYYLIINRFFASDLSKVGSITAQFNDCNDGGNIAEQQKFIEDGTEKEYYRDYEIVYALQNPDQGVPSTIYNALKVAYNKGFIGADTRWDEGITKYEAIKLITEALKLETGIEQFDFALSTAAAATSNTADNTEVTTESTDIDAEGGLIMDAAGVDGVISEEDIAAGAYDEELNGEDTTSKDTTSSETPNANNWENMTQEEWDNLPAEEREKIINAIVDEMTEEYYRERGIDPNKAIIGDNNESEPDHLPGNPLPEGYVTPDNGELPPSNFGSGGAPESLKGAFIQ